MTLDEVLAQPVRDQGDKALGDGDGELGAACELRLDRVSIAEIVENLLQRPFPDVRPGVIDEVQDDFLATSLDEGIHQLRADAPALGDGNLLSRPL